MVFYFFESQIAEKCLLTVKVADPVLVALLILGTLI